MGRATPRAPRATLVSLLGGIILIAALAGCIGPRAHIPPRVPPASRPPRDSQAALAVTLAPVLYLQRDETFRLERVVAAVHPERRIIAYYLLWSDDVNGAWVPFTVPTDEEVVWVGYDSTRAPTEVWTYWHGDILHAPWPRSRVEIDVQWGKHGSMPRNVRLNDLPLSRSLDTFYATATFGLLDVAFGDLNRPGPMCFCHGFRRYLEFTRPLPLDTALDAVVVDADPRSTLAAVFGKKYSRKPLWPWLKHGQGPGVVGSRGAAREARNAGRDTTGGGGSRGSRNQEGGIAPSAPTIVVPSAARELHVRTSRDWDGRAVPSLRAG